MNSAQLPALGAKNRPAWRFVPFVLLINTLVAGALSLWGPERFLINLVYSHCIGLLMYFVIDSLRCAVWQRGVRSPLVLFGIALIAAPVAWFGGSALACLLLGRPIGMGALGPNAVLGFLALTAGCGLAGTYFFWSREQLVESERGTAEARLKLLQAQIEPHFLFNTLANLQALIAVDPARAQAMLGHLDAYLRATLATTRKDSGTLAEEFALLRGYLEILAIRMGARLAWELDLPDALAGSALPPMLLQPLVENAIRHGLEPKIEGGMVRVTARRTDDRLVLVVQDDGLGARAPARAGEGIGVSNVKARLAATYGETASFELGELPSGGTRVTLRIPLQG